MPLTHDTSGVPTCGEVSNDTHTHISIMLAYTLAWIMPNILMIIACNPGQMRESHVCDPLSVSSFLDRKRHAQSERVLTELLDGTKGSGMATQCLQACSQLAFFLHVFLLCMQLAPVAAKVLRKYMWQATVQKAHQEHSH